MNVFKKKYYSVLLMSCCILSSCCHSGISVTMDKMKTIDIKEDSLLLPKGVTEFTISAGNVIRIETSGHIAKEKQFLLERENQIQLSFHYTKGDYSLMPGDDIRVSFLTDQSLNYDITIRLDGRISIPKIGELYAAGKTPKQLGKDITMEFRGKINDPRAIVSVLRTNLDPILSMQGEYNILPDGTLHLPVLGTFTAAGLSPESLEKNISTAISNTFKNNFTATVVARNFVSRKLEEYERIVTVTPAGEIILPEIGSIHVQGLSMNELKLRIQNALTLQYSNDIDVSITLISGGNHSVYVSGDVKFPGVYPLAPSMTMLKALMLSGGATRTGNIEEAVLIHYDKAGDLLIFKTNLKEVIKEGKKIQDLKLSPQDIVYIPSSGIAEANRFIEQYITGMLPFSRSASYNYNKNPDLNQ